MYAAIGEARHKAALRSQRFTLHWAHALEPGRRLILASPPCLWSTVHRSVNAAVREGGRAFVKTGQVLFPETLSPIL